MMSSDRLADDIRWRDMVDRARSVRIEVEVARRGITLQRKHGELIGACPRCGGSDRFSVHVDKGVWHCRGCKPDAIKGNVIGFVMWIDGVDFATAVETLAGDRARRQVEPVEQPTNNGNDEGERERQRRAFRYWQESKPPTGTLGEHYFVAHRHLPISHLPPLDHVLRFHPDKCMVVALMTDPASAEPTGIHRIFLDRDGAKHGDRMMLGRAGVIRLSPDDEVTHSLGLAEGIEKGVAILLGGWAPVWAAGSAGGIARFPILAGVEALTIFSDPGPVGARAAHGCAARWRDAGWEAVIRPPPMEAA